MAETYTFTTVYDPNNKGEQTIDVEYNNGSKIVFKEVHFPNMKKRDKSGKEEFILDPRTGKKKEYIRFICEVDGVETRDVSLTMFTRNRPEFNSDGSVRVVHEHTGDIYAKILEAIKGKATLKERGNAVLDLLKPLNLCISVTDTWWTPDSTLAKRILDLAEVPATK